MAVLRSRQLAADGREHALDLIAQGDQNRDGHHRDEGQDECILNQGLTLLALETTQRRFGASNNFVNHCIFHLLSMENVQNFKNGAALRRLFSHRNNHFACQIKIASGKDFAL